MRKHFLFSLIALLVISCGEDDSLPSFDSPDLQLKIVPREKAGNYEQTSYYRDSIRHGSYQLYEDSVLIINGQYYHDTMVGSWSYYDTSGSLMRTANYKANQLNGADTTYYPDGKTKSTGVYIYTKEQGPWYYYYPNGQLKHKCVFDEGKPMERSYISFDSLGNLKTDTTNFNLNIH